MKKTLLAAAIAVAAGLAGCATGPYDAYGYGPTYDPNYYGYYNGSPYYEGPSIGLGYYYYDGDGHRHWRAHDDGRNYRDHQPRLKPYPRRGRRG